MRIAQVAPLYESVPPKFYGGTERVVAYLTDELVRLGHEVTLFASGDSCSPAKLEPIGGSALRLDPTAIDDLAPHVLELERVARQCRNFDIVHFHLSYLHFLVCRGMAVPTVSTLHGRLDQPQLGPLFAEFRDVPLVSISESQRSQLPDVDWCGTVHHGLPRDLHGFVPRDDGYFAFLGRLSRDKRVDRAITIAKRLGVPLRIAAKVDRHDALYFKEQIAPLLDDPLIEFVGEIGEREKGEFLGRARALLFPIDWPEPFGLVVIEAMACGTPVVAFGCGSVPELIDDGVTGYVVGDLDAAVAAAANVRNIDRSTCRRVFERRFSVERVAQDYLAVYANAIARSGRARRPRRPREAAA